jgi:group I intron endonuclease
MKCQYKGSVVYSISNTINNKIYIGSTVSFSDRRAAHITQLRGNRHTNKHLQRAWNKYSEEVFTFDIIEYINKDRLLEREQHWINFLKPEYNILKVAGSNLGFKHSYKTIEKIKKSLLGHTRWSKKLKQEFGLKRKGKSNPNYGIPITEEHREIVRKANKGKVISEKHKLILAKTMRKTMKGKVSHNKGKRRIINPVTGKQQYI